MTDTLILEALNENKIKVAPKNSLNQDLVIIVVRIEYKLKCKYITIFQILYTSLKGPRFYLNEEN